MYPPDPPAFTAQSGAASVDGATTTRGPESSPDQGTAARADLLTRWLREDTPPGKVAPALYADRRHDFLDRVPNLATAYANGHFPHIDAASGMSRDAVACRSIGKTALRDALVTAIERPLREQGGELSPRAVLLLRELLFDLTDELLGAVVVEVLDPHSGRTTPDELHLIVCDYRGTIRVSVLPHTAGCRHRVGPTPDSRFTVDGCGCPDGRVPDDNEPDHAGLLPRPARAAEILRDGLPLSLRSEFAFDVRIATHGLRHVDAEAVRFWLPPSAWEIERAEPDAQVPDTREWLIGLDTYRDAFLDSCGSWDYEHDLDEDGPALGRKDRIELAAALWSELVDAPLRRVAKGDPSAVADALRVIGQWGSGKADGADAYARVMVFGPRETLLLEIDPWN
ncbi:hypothetical protein [Embleya sp. NPDC001921]